MAKTYTTTNEIHFGGKNGRVVIPAGTEITSKDVDGKENFKALLQAGVLQVEEVADEEPTQPAQPNPDNK